MGREKRPRKKRWSPSARRPLILMSLPCGAPHVKALIVCAQIFGSLSAGHLLRISIHSIEFLVCVLWPFDVVTTRLRQSWWMRLSVASQPLYCLCEITHTRRSCRPPLKIAQTNDRYQRWWLSHSPPSKECIGARQEAMTRLVQLDIDIHAHFFSPPLLSSSLPKNSEMSGHYEPHVVFSLDGVTASAIQDGRSSSLTPSGPQTMSLLLVSSSSPFADLGSARTQNEAPEEDYYLHLNLPPELDLPLPATTQIFHQPPRGYLIPRPDAKRDSGAFVRIELPEKIHQEEIDTFETILAQCTAFLERAPPPTGDATHRPYDPRDYAPGGKLSAGKTPPGQIVLVDEDDGSVVGELAEGATIIEDPRLAHGSKTPVEIEVSPDGHSVNVRPVSDDYLRMANHRDYRDSSLVKHAASASRLIVTQSNTVCNLLASGADSFTKKTTPVEKPLVFSAAAHERARKLHSFATGTANVSAKTVGQATKMTQNLAAHIAGRGKAKDGKEGGGRHMPSFLNKSLIAFNTVADGVTESGKSILSTSTSAATTVFGHRYGPDAQKLAANIAGSVKNVGLVYIDVTGVTRRALLKSVAKGMIVGRVKDGRTVVVGSGDGGAIPEADIQNFSGAGGVTTEYSTLGKPQVAEFGNVSSHAPPPGYTSELGEPLGSTTDAYRKS